MIEQVCLSEVLLDGAKEVFETMVFMSLEPCLEDDRDIEGRALMGTITFQNDLEGCLAICCGMPCARAVAAGMLGLEPDEQIDETDVCDAVGEITNMIMGTVKSRLQDVAGDLQVSIPSVVRGRELTNSLGDGARKISIKVSIEDEHVALLSLLYRDNSGKSD